MHPFLARLAGKPALQNWRDHVAACEKALEKIDRAAAPAGDFSARIAAARADLNSDPTPAKVEKLIVLLSQSDAAFKVDQEMRSLVQNRRKELLAAGHEKFDAAFAEVRAALVVTRAQIRSEDAERSEKLGAPVESVAPLAAITLQIRQLDEARQMSGMDFEIASTARRSVTGGSRATPIQFRRPGDLVDGLMAVQSAGRSSSRPARTFCRYAPHRFQDAAGAAHFGFCKVR
jgi:hypothetical protein